MWTSISEIYVVSVRLPGFHEIGLQMPNTFDIEAGNEIKKWMGKDCGTWIKYNFLLWETNILTSPCVPKYMFCKNKHFRSSSLEISKLYQLKLICWNNFFHFKFIVGNNLILGYLFKKNIYYSSPNWNNWNTFGNINIFFQQNSLFWLKLFNHKFSPSIIVTLFAYHQLDLN